MSSSSTGGSAPDLEQKQKEVRAAESLESYRKGKRFVKDVVREMLRTKDNQLVRTMARHEVVAQKMTHKIKNLTGKVNSAEREATIKEDEAKELKSTIDLLNRAVMHVNAQGNLSQDLQDKLIRKTNIVITRDMNSEHIVGELEKELAALQEKEKMQQDEKTLLEENVRQLRHAMELLLGKAESTLEQRGREAVDALVAEAKDDMSKVKELRKDPHLAKIAEERARQLEEMSMVKKEMDKLKGDKKALENSLKKAEGEVVQMRLKMMERDSSVAAFNKKIKAVETKLHEEVSTSGARIEAAEKLAGELTMKYEGELRKIKDSLETTSKRLGEQTKMIDYYKAQVSEAKFESARIKKDMENARGEMREKLKHQEEEMEQHIQELTDKMNAEAADLTNKYAQAETTALRRANELNELREEFERVNAALLQAREEVADQLVQLEDQKAVMEAGSVDARGASIEFRNMREKIRSLEADMDEKNQSIQLLEDLKNQMQEDLLSSKSIGQSFQAEEPAKSVTPKMTPRGKKDEDHSPKEKKEKKHGKKKPAKSPQPGHLSRVTSSVSDVASSGENFTLAGHLAKNEIKSPALRALLNKSQPNTPQEDSRGLSNDFSNQGSTSEEGISPLSGTSFDLDAVLAGGDGVELPKVLQRKSTGEDSVKSKPIESLSVTPRDARRLSLESPKTDFALNIQPPTPQASGMGTRQTLAIDTPSLASPLTNSGIPNIADITTPIRDDGEPFLDGLEALLDTESLMVLVNLAKSDPSKNREGLTNALKGLGDRITLLRHWEQNASSVSRGLGAQKLTACVTELSMSLVELSTLQASIGPVQVKTETILSPLTSRGGESTGDILTPPQLESLMDGSTSVAPPQVLDETMRGSSPSSKLRSRPTTTHTERQEASQSDSTMVPSPAFTIQGSSSFNKESSVPTPSQQAEDACQDPSRRSSVQDVSRKNSLSKNSQDSVEEKGPARVATFSLKDVTLPDHINQQRAKAPVKLVAKKVVQKRKASERPKSWNAGSRPSVSDIEVKLPESIKEETLLSGFQGTASDNLKGGDVNPDTIGEAKVSQQHTEAPKNWEETLAMDMEKLAGEQVEEEGNASGTSPPTSEGLECKYYDEEGNSIDFESLKEQGYEMNHEGEVVLRNNASLKGQSSGKDLSTQTSFRVVSLPPGSVLRASSSHNSPPPVRGNTDSSQQAVHERSDALSLYSNSGSVLLQAESTSLPRALESVAAQPESPQHHGYQHYVVETEEHSTQWTGTTTSLSSTLNNLQSTAENARARGLLAQVADSSCQTTETRISGAEEGETRSDTEERSGALSLLLGLEASPTIPPVGSPASGGVKKLKSPATLGDLAPSREPSISPLPSELQGDSRGSSQSGGFGKRDSALGIASGGLAPQRQSTSSSGVHDHHLSGLKTRSAADLLGTTPSTQALPEVSSRDAVRHETKTKHLAKLAKKLGVQTGGPVNLTISSAPESEHKITPEEQKLLVAMSLMEKSGRNAIQRSAEQVIWEVYQAFKSHRMEIEVRDCSDAFLGEISAKADNTDVLAADLKKFVDGQMNLEKERLRSHQNELITLRTTLSVVAKVGVSSEAEAAQLAELQRNVDGLLQDDLALEVVNEDLVAQIPSSRYNQIIRQANEIQHQLNSQRVVSNLHQAMQDSHQRQIAELRAQLTERGSVARAGTATSEGTRKSTPNETAALLESTAGSIQKGTFLPGMHPIQTPPSTAGIADTAFPPPGPSAENNISPPATPAGGSSMTPASNTTTTVPSKMRETVVRAQALEREREVQVASLYNTVGAFMMEAQELVKSDHLPSQQPIHFKDRPLISQTQVQSKLNALLDALKRSSDENNKTAETKKKEKREKKEKKERRRERKSTDDGVSTLGGLEQESTVFVPPAGSQVGTDSTPQTPTDSRPLVIGEDDQSQEGTSTGIVVETAEGERKLLASASLLERTERSEVEVDTQDDLLDIASLQQAAEELGVVTATKEEKEQELESLINILSQHDELARAAKLVKQSKSKAPSVHLLEPENWHQQTREQKLGKVLTMANKKLEKVQLRDLLDKQLRAGVALSLNSALEDPARGDTALKILGRTRRRALRAVIAHEATAFHNFDKDQQFMQGMFKSFPRVFVENAASGFDPDMTFELVSKLSRWWNDWSQKHSDLQGAMTVEKQRCMERLIHLCELLEQTSLTVNAEYHHLAQLKKGASSGTPGLGDDALADYLMKSAQRKQLKMLEKIDKVVSKPMTGGERGLSHTLPVGGARPSQILGARSSTPGTETGLFGLAGRTTVKVHDPKFQAKSSQLPSNLKYRRASSQQRSESGISYYEQERLANAVESLDYLEQNPQFQMTMSKIKARNDLPTVAELKRPKPNLGDNLPYFNKRAHGSGSSPQTEGLASQGPAPMTPPPLFSRHVTPTPGQKFSVKGVKAKTPEPSKASVTGLGTSPKVSSSGDRVITITDSSDKKGSKLPSIGRTRNGGIGFKNNK